MKFNEKNSCFDNKKKDLFWSYISILLKLGGSLIILPVVLHKLPSSELAMWYLFLNVGNLCMMFDFGFAETISRNVAYINSGKNKLYSYDINDKDTKNIKIGMYEFLHAIRILYKVLSVIVIIISLILGTVFIFPKITDISNSSNITLAWFLYIFAVALNMYFNYTNALLTGIDKIHYIQKTSAIAATLNYSVVGILIFNNFGLISLSIGMMINVLFIRVTCSRYIKNTIKNDGYNNNISIMKIIKILWPTTWRTGMSSLMGFFIANMNTFLCSKFYGLDNTARYGLTLQCINVIIQLSVVWVNTSIPKINRLRIDKNTNKIKKIFSKRIFIGYINFAFFSVNFVILGPILLKIIHSKTNLLSANLILLFLFYMFLDYNHNQYGLLIMTQNKIPFLKASFISASVILAMNFIFYYIFHTGLEGLLYSSFIGGIIFNNWYWPIVGAKSIDSSPLEIVKCGYCEVKNDGKKIVNNMFANI